MRGNKQKNEENIGNKLVLYSMPVIVVAAILNDKPTWTLAAHTGIPVARHGGDNLSKAHYINKDIKENKALSVNVVDEGWLAKADYTGCVAGNKTDKSALFAYTVGGRARR